MSETIIKPYEVGKFYDIPVAVVNKDNYYGGFGWGAIIPILGELHEDKEIIKFPHFHYHVDWRFVQARNYRWNVYPEHWEGHEYAVVIQAEHVVEIKTLQLKCKRDFGPYPFDKAERNWLPELRKKYQHATAKNGRCPHKGVDMTTLKPDADGCVTCPLHGLKWGIKNWRLQL